MRYPKKPKKKHVHFCPMCGKTLKYQDGSFEPIYWCPTSIKFQGGKEKFHYVFDHSTNTSEMIVMPYRVISSNNSSKIAIHISPDDPKATHAYKVGLWLFKTICTINAKIPPMESNKLLQKIKTYILFS